MGNVLALSATASPASTPSALAKKEAIAWVESGILQLNSWHFRHQQSDLLQYEHLY